VETNKLIERLTTGVGRVRPLAAPWRRTVAWVGASIVTTLLVGAFHTTSGGSTGTLDARFVLEEFAIFATAVTAAIAALSSVVPGRDWRLALLPLLPLAIWLATLGQGCAQDWLRLGADGLTLRADWDCGLAALLIGVVPASLMVAMLRRGAPLVPGLALALGALAVASVINLGLRIFHVGDISLMVLVWHFGGVLVATVLARQFGSQVLRWQTVTVPGNQPGPHGIVSL
jgi:hypothetical protein